MSRNVPGSRSDRADAKRKTRMRTDVREYVGINFVCAKHGNTMGRVRMETYDGADRQVLILPLPDGTLPEDGGHHGKLLLLCAAPGCRRDVQIQGDAVKAALDALWAPHRRRVVTKRV